MIKTKTGPVSLLLAIFFINFLSLVYQVVWVRKIMVIFGTSALSISTVLTVFLAGIAVGGYIGGRIIKKVERKYLFAGLSLVALGIYCMASLYIFGLVRYPFMLISGSVENPIALNMAKFLLSSLILIFPTTVIGAMFPVVTHLYSFEFKRLGRDVASIYSLDTLGAAIGAALCGFFLVPMLGLAVTSAVSGAIYVAIGLLVMRMEKPEFEYAAEASDGSSFEAGEAVEAGAVEKTALSGMHMLILVALFTTGFSALLLEVTWSRFFHLLFGSSIYAFALVLAAFLAGLSLGSYAIHRYLDRIKSPKLVFAFVLILIAGFSMVVVQTSSHMEALYIYLYHSTSSFYIFQALLFAAAFVVMLIPTSLMGANFPLAVRIFARSRDRRGSDTGLIFSVNTAGGIIGAFAAGFFIIPFLGLEKTGILASLVYLTVGFVFLFTASGRKSVHASAAMVMATLFFAFGYASYGEPDLDISVYYNGIRNDTTAESYFAYKKNTNIIYSKQGLYGLVAVDYDTTNNNLVLWTNGKADASIGKRDMVHQVLLGHLPFFFHKAPENVLNIGFGSGITTGGIATHKNVRSIDVAEIDPLVVEAAGMFFGYFNNSVLEDPRVKVHFEDGRHFLDTSGKMYDVIVSQPSNIWISGISQLFTTEFYKIADEHLNPGGVFAQWMPGYEMEDDDVRLILSTMKKRFEHVIYWSDGLEIIILASHDPLEIDYEYTARLMSDPDVVRDLSKTIPSPDRGKVNTLLYDAVSSRYTIPTYLGDYRHINTDNHNLLEFRTVRNSYNVHHIGR